MLFIPQKGHKDIYLINIPEAGGKRVMIWLKKCVETQVGFEGSREIIELEKNNVLQDTPYQNCVYIPVNVLPQGTKHFVICRNPYTRLLSFYNDIRLKLSHKLPKSGEDPTTPESFLRKNLPDEFSFGFDHFVRSLNLSIRDFELKRAILFPEDFAKISKGWDIGTTYTQKNWIDTENLPLYTLKYENLEEDFKIIQEYYDFFEPLPPLPSLNLPHEPLVKKATMDDYTPELADYVYENWKEDFEYFGYDRELPSV